MGTEDGTRETNLVIACAEDELGVRVQVQNTLDNLALVDRNRADLEVLFAHENYETAQQTQMLHQVRCQRYLRSAVCERGCSRASLDTAGTGIAYKFRNSARVR